MTFTIEKPPDLPDLQYYLQAPRWVDILARLYLLLVAGLQWLGVTLPKLSVYLVTRYDLVRRSLPVFPPAHWVVGWQFIAAVAFFIWIELGYNVAVMLIGKGVA